MAPDYRHIRLTNPAEGLLKIELISSNTMWSLNEHSVTELLEGLTHFNGAEKYKVLVLAGSGPAFCVGADLNIDMSLNEEELVPLLGESTRSQMEQLLNPLVEQLFNSNKATICAVNGVVAGGGLGLALAADIVIAAESARFIQVFMPKLGIIPDLGCTWIMPRLVGRSRAMALGMLGDSISAHQAETYGMIWRCVDDKLLEQEVETTARRLLSVPLSAIEAFKQAMKASEENSYEQQLALECRLQTDLCGSKNFIEGVKAFKARRDPDFSF